MRARLIFVIVLGIVTTPLSARTLIDMPAPKGAAITYLTENPSQQPGAVALNRYSYGRVTPLYSYMSPPVRWPYWSGWSGWRVGHPFGFGFGFGSGWPWGWGCRYPFGARLGLGFGFGGGFVIRSRSPTWSCR